MAFIRAAQGQSGPSPTRITPGNSNPPYLVEDEVYVMNGNGRAIGSLTSITPSDSSPVFLRPNNIYKPDVSGYAVGSVTSITPSNSTPASLSTSYVYKPSESGYAIKSYQSITPSASGAAFNAGFVKMSAGGYACTSQPGAGNYGLLYTTKTSSQGLNSWTISKGSYSSMSVAFLQVCVYSNSTRSNASGQYIFFIDNLHDSGYYHYIAGSSSTGARVATAYPATSSKRLSYSDSNGNIIVSFYESNSGGRPVNDIFVMLKA